ncbi:seven transmembrane protein 1-like isoform X2 [Macadamia integrifolia]|uniref:seven transmembrane protein 1-like isoform X2 n=1 Tax=Macadamia integrifolia TaxID=60698 RepID=UPI001C4E90D7|nr:seven transmembrane protein 1-like isoform X2 [Macadamia integrifolia]
MKSHPRVKVLNCYRFIAPLAARWLGFSLFSATSTQIPASYSSSPRKETSFLVFFLCIRIEVGESSDVMGLRKGSMPVCPRNQHCSQWARIYMKFCLCGVKDGISLGLGLVSVISWGVAEVPQIITNYKEKSTEGLSIAFLLTWIIGDLFNLFGCLLEPATLPTQYYMAVLYTITTVILTSQTIYYRHIYHRLKSRRRDQKSSMLLQKETVDKESIVDENQTKISDGVLRVSSPIAVISPDGSHGRTFYYMSARSLSKSPTPMPGAYIARSPNTILGRHSLQEPLLNEIVSTRSASAVKNKSILCVVSAMTLFIKMFGLHSSDHNRSDISTNKPAGVVIHVGRKLLQTGGGLLLLNEVEENSGIGTFLGWAMAAIYMGGRLPQIFLNIRRGNVEGLNPLMFVFALVGNVTYVASILVSSMRWSKIRPNMPWLVDAGGCVLLDFFILLQFIYYHYRKPSTPKSKHGELSTA